MNLAKNWRIAVLVFFVSVSLLLVAVKGLSYGIDFIGGTELKLELEQGGEAYQSTVVSILKERLNGLGLKATQVLPEADGRHITIKVSAVNQTDLTRVKDILYKQAVFEQMVDGGLCAKGDEIQLDIGQNNGAFVDGTRWEVYVKTTGDAPMRCGNVMSGKAGRMTDIFLDRPSRSFMLLDSGTCADLASRDFANHPSDVGYTELSFIEDRALIPVVCYDAEKEAEVINETLLEEFGIEVNITKAANQTALDLGAAMDEMQRLANSGNKTSIITLVNLTQLPQQLQDKIAELNITVRVYPKSIDQPFHEDNNPESWIVNVVGLKSTLEIDKDLTYGKPLYGSRFQGTSPTPKDASETADSFKIWLTSGNLPVKLTIVLERPNLPELGQQFLQYVGLIALLALGIVASIIAFRYRNIKVFGLLLITSFSEIIIILGFASISSWELDMAAFAGIIAAIGTGIDHQIVITDETLRGERKSKGKKESQIWDVKNALNRAFFIIFTSATTTILAMLPLMSIPDLKGFAFTSIMGVLIGILITRPAYGRMMELSS